MSRTDHRESRPQRAGYEIPIEEICSSNRYLSLEDQDEIDAYAQYLTYRVQRDLYELCREKAGGLPDGWLWDDFVLAVCSIKRLRDAAIAVFRRTLSDFLHHDAFHFHTENINFLDPADVRGQRNDSFRCSQLFPAEKGRAIVCAILFRCEIAYYHDQLNAGRDYTWEQYLKELLERQQMWDALVTAFRDALTRLDFKPAWESEETVKLLGDGAQKA